MRRVLGLVGEPGSGKDTFCDYLNRNRKDVFILRFSQPLTEALRIFFDQVKREDQQWLVIALRKRFGNNILGEAVAKKIKNIKKGLIILNGVRMWEEFKMIKKLGGKIIYITADSKIRWQRVSKRGEKKDDKVSYQKFLKMEKAASEILIPEIGKKADYKIENNGSVKDLYRSIKTVLNK